MSRRLEPRDLEAIARVRMALKEDSSNSGQNQDEKLADELEGGTLGEFQQEMLVRDKVVGVGIMGHALNGDAGREFVAYEVEVATADLTFRVARRFSEFHALFKRVRRATTLKCDFPKKVLNPFVSSTHRAVVEERAAKLHIFLRELLDRVRVGKDASVAQALFAFLGLREHYEQKRLIISYKKSNSEQLGYRLLVPRPALSQGLRAKCEESTLEFRLLLLSQNTNSGKCLREIQEFVRNKRAKLGAEEARLLFMGSEECTGLLQYALNNPSEVNRALALQLLLGLLSPQKNMHNERIQKALQRVPPEDFRVEKVSYFDNPVFKALYFDLLSNYCARAEKELKVSEAELFKDLFRFHMDLSQDYYQWKKLAENTHYWPNESSKNVDQCLKIELTQFEEDSPSFVKISGNESSGSLYLSQLNKTIVICLSTKRALKDLEFVDCNRYISNISEDSYTSIVRAMMSINGKKIGLRIKPVKPGEEETLPEAFRVMARGLKEIEEISSLLEKYELRMIKEEYPSDFQREYAQQLWVRSEEKGSKVVIACQLGENWSANELQQFAKAFYADLVAKLSL